MEQRDDLAEIFAKFPTYRCVQVVVPKSLVPWFQLSTVCRLRTDWIPVSITVNHNACLGEIYIAIPRQLIDTKKTFGRLYLTVLDFSLLQRLTSHGFNCKLLIVGDSASVVRVAVVTSRHNVDNDK